MNTKEILQGIKDWAAPKVIYDISAAHNNTKYTDLSDALGNNGGNIPQEYRKGGITVRYVQSSDNKYVQFRYMSSSTAVADFTNVANWQGVDDEPTAGSDNLVKSGAVYTGFAALSDSIETVDTNAKNGISELRGDIDGIDNYTSGGWIGRDGITIISNSDYAYSDYIDVTEGDNITVVKGLSDIDLYASFYPVNEGEILFYILSAGSVSRSFSVQSGYNRLRFSFNKDRDAKVLRGSTVIWEKTHEKGIAEKLDDTVQVVEQSLTTAQQNQAKANIGLPPGIDSAPLNESVNLVTSGGVKSVVDKAEATAEVALSKINGGTANLLTVEKEINNEFINYNNANFALYKPAKKIVIKSTLTGDNVGGYMCYLYDKDGNKENSPTYANGSTITINKSYEIVRIVVNYLGQRYTGTLTVTVDTQLEAGILSDVANLQASLNEVTADVNNLDVTVNGGIVTIGDEILHASNAFVNYSNLYCNFNKPLRTFTLRVNVPSGLGITQYSIYVYKTDNTSAFYGPFDVNTDVEFPDKGFDIIKVAVAQIVPNVRYNGDFELKVTVYQDRVVARTCEVDEVKDWTGYDERVVVPDYYFTNDYLGNKVSFVRNLLEGCMTNGDAFFFQTDEHWEMNAQHSPALVKYIADRLNISRLFDGGDTTHNIDANGFHHTSPAAIDFNMLRDRTYKGDIYHTIGNHEYLTWGFERGTNPYASVDFDNWHDFLYYQQHDRIVYGDSDKHYYYVDNKQKKIRYIVLSSYKKKETPIESGNLDYSIAEYNYSADQLNWFVNQALSVEQEWTIIVFSHNFISYTHGERDGEGYIASVTPFVPDASKPFARAILQYNGNGTIAAVFAGHWHSDAVLTVNDALAGLSDTPTGKTFPCIVTTCDAYNFNGLGEEERLYNRTVDTITEQAFDVVVLDKTARKFTLVRIGGPAYNILVQAPNGKYPLFGDLEYREVTY